MAGKGILISFKTNKPVFRRHKTANNYHSHAQAYKILKQYYGEKQFKGLFALNGTITVARCEVLHTR